MSERGPHPFPPVVRWAVFPALAALAAAAGGFAACTLLSSGNLLASTVLVGNLAVGSALGSMVSRRRWVFLAAAPILGVLAVCAGVSLTDSRGPSRSPLDMLLGLLRNPQICLLLLGTAWLQGAAHTQSIHLRPAFRTLFSMGLYGGAAALAAFLAVLCIEHGPQTEAAALLFLSTASQVVAFRASLALARRLQPDTFQRV